MKNFYFGKSIIQLHSKEVQAENGNWYCGYIEHDLRRNNWFILCYVMPTNDFSTCCEDPYDVVYGLGNTLIEAANDIRNHERYGMYPLLKAFG